MAESHIFQWDGGGGEVQLVGSFSVPGFSPWQPIPVTNRNSAGGVYVDLELPVGCHQYMFKVDGEWRLDPSNILPVVSGRNQVILSDFQLGDAGLPQPQGQGASFSLEYEPRDSDSDEEDSESDTESIASSVASSINAPGGEPTTKLYLQFPKEAKNHVKNHLVSHGYKNNIIHFNVLKNCVSAIVAMTPASIGETVISSFNGSLVNGQFRLTVKPYMKKKPDASNPDASKKKRNKRKKKNASAEPAVQTAPVPLYGTGLAPPVPPTGTCRVFFGSKLPPYTNEQHIKDHFRNFAASILNVELIRDKRTKEFKGFGFIVFRNAGSAQAAISALNHSNLLGISIRVSLEKSQDKSVPPPSLFDQTQPSQDPEDLSDTESVSSNFSTQGDKIKVIVHSRPKLPDIPNKVFKSHFKQFNHGISHAFIVRNKEKQSQGYGIIVFKSSEVAEQAMEKMRGTKIQGKYELISLFIQGQGKSKVAPGNTPGLPGASASVPAGLSAYRPPPASPVSHPQSQASCTVVVKNLDPLVGESEIRSVINVSMLSFVRYPSPSNDVVIKFSYASDAQMAVDALNGRKFMEQVVHAFIQPEPTPAPPAYQRSQSNPAFLTSPVLPSHPPANPGAQYGYQGQPHPPGPHDQPHPPGPHGQPRPPGPYGQPRPPGPHGQPHPPGPYGQPHPPVPHGQPHPPGPHGQPHPPGPHGQPHPPGPHGQPHPPGPQGQPPSHFGPPFQQPRPQGPPGQGYFGPPGQPRPPGPHPPGQPLPPRPLGPYPPGPPAQPHPPGVQVSPTKPEAPISPEKLLPSDSVKVTHLPPGITKEKLLEHFKMAGEIKGMPNIHHTAKTTYAHVNFVEPSAAKFAAEHLNGSSIDGVSLTVKLQPKKKPPKAKQVPTEEKEFDPNNFEKVMKLEESQWNSLMLVKRGTTQFKEIMAPFKSNPNVMVTPLLEESRIKFTGKQDAVKDAFSFLKRSLSKEITIDSKPKREALVHLRPTLPDDLRQKYGVSIPEYQSVNLTITFDKPNEKAYDEVNALVSNLQLIEVPLSGEYGLDRLEQVRVEVPAAVYICAPESVPRKSVILCAFDMALMNSITPRVKQLLAVSTVQCDCKPEEGVFLKLFNRAFVDNFPAKVSFSEEGRMTLAGGDDAIQVSMARIRELLQGLYSRKFTFMCSPRFLPRIEQVVIPYGMEESSFKYYTQKGCGGGGRKRRGSQAKSGGSEEIAVYIFCRNEQVFQRAGELLRRFKPSSRTFHFNHKGVDEVIKSMKSQLEKDYFVEVLDKGPGSLLIHGLDPDEIQKCHDMIKEKVETTLVVTKYEPVNLQLFALLKLYGLELAEIRRGCQELTVLPPNKEHEGSCLIRIKGTIAQVEDVKSRLSSCLLSMNVASTTIDLSCPQGLFGMWCKRWNQVKEQEAKRSKVNIEFSKSADAADTKSLNVHFDVVGTDNTVVQEVAGAILAEGTETEEKTFSLSANGCGCLLKAKRDKKLDFLNNTVVYVGNINKQANTVTLCAPKELSDNLDTAEEQVRRFVGERASTSHVISSRDPVVGLILSSPTRSQQYITTANALAKDHKVSVHILKKPSIGLRITGTEASIASVKMLINATVIEAIERTIMEKRVSVKHQYSSFLSSPDFSRFLSKLESDFSVICSYPRAGKTSKLVAASLIHMDNQGQYVKVDICRGSVVHELVDAIVNAANEDLKHIGGLAKAILDAGGPAIQTESDDHVRMNGKVRPGSAVCLSAGNLPCKRIVHAVGPRWNGGQRGEEQTLYFTIFHSLEAANKESLSSIAFPAIGTGVFNVPLDLCARASLKAVRDFCMANPNTTIQNVKFVLFQQDAVDAFKPLLVSGICGEYQYGSASRPHAKHIAPDESLAVFSPISTASAQSSDWQWYNDKGRFVSYGPDISSKLSSAYRANPKGSTNVLINGVTYDINFAHMIQTNPITGHRRPIQHATASSSAVEWQYQNDVGSYSSYTAADSASIENMYQAKKPDHLFINGKAYTFDFTQMCQINITTGFKRPIHRQTHTPSSAGTSLAAAAAAPEPLDEEDEPESESEDIVLTLRGPYDSLEAAETKVRSKLDSAWKKQKIDKLPKNMGEDLEKKIAHIAKRNDVICMFEKSKRGKTSQKVLNLEGISFKVQAAASAIQEEILTFHLSTSQDEVKYPDEWQPQQKTMQLFPVLQGSPEWQRVEGKFALTMGAGRVQNITRVQNKWVWEKYATQKKRLDRKNSGRVNEMELFHGTRNNDPKVIYDGEEGFDMRYGRQGMWGVANYFAVNASYSHSYAYTGGGSRQMFLVKVLTGDSCNCNPDGSLRMPPTKTAAQGGDVQFEQMKYDTVTGYTNGSQVFMTYDNDKAYPAYLIAYV